MSWIIDRASDRIAFQRLRPRWKNRFALAGAVEDSEPPYGYYNEYLVECEIDEAGNIKILEQTLLHFPKPEKNDEGEYAADSFIFIQQQNNAGVIRGDSIYLTIRYGDGEDPREHHYFGIRVE